MAKPLKQIERKRCKVCREWNLPKDMLNTQVCIYCVDEGRIKIKKERSDAAV